MENYESISSEYYDPVKHPTCNNFGDASSTLVGRFLDQQQTNDSLICDIGAGRSVVDEYFKKTNKPFLNLVLFDSSIGMLRHSKISRSSKIFKIVSDATSLPLRDQSVDIVVASLGDPFNTRRFWLEVARTLKPGGKAFYTTPSFEWASDFRMNSETERPMLAKFDTTTGQRVYLLSRILPPAHQAAEIESTGLSMVAIHHFRTSALKTPLSPKLFSRDARKVRSPVTAYEIVKKQI